jgi:hypothetical protein
MAIGSIRRFYTRADFAAIGNNAINLGILRATLTALSLTEPIDSVTPQANGGVVVEWANLPTQADFTAVDNVIATHTGGTTTKSPFRATQESAVDAISSSQVPVVSIQTPPLDAGDYQVSGAMMFQLTGEVAGTKAQVRFNLNDNLINGTTTDLDQPVAYNFSFPLTKTAGSIIKIDILVSKLGASANTARVLAGATIAVDPL